MFAFVDHFEPGHGKADLIKADERMNTWYVRYPEMASKHRDADGQFPKHTWFFPPHYYNKAHVNQLNDLVFNGYGEIEFHLHHGNDTAGSLERKIRDTLELYGKHGIFVTAEQKPQCRYAFIHGDWALDNSREPRHCGVNNELQILNKTGCFVDMTFPSLHQAQPQKINSIYYAADNPDKPKSYNWGKDVRIDREKSGDLMLIQGPLSINWKDWHHTFYPAFETGEVVKEYPATEKRVDFWVKTHIHVRGRPDWIFIKVHTHGAVDKDHETLLGEARDKLHTYLEEKYNDGRDYVLHYVSAREMYNIVKAAEDGKNGNPNEYRDYRIPCYANQLVRSQQYFRLDSYAKDLIHLSLLEDSGSFVFKDILLEKISGRFTELSIKILGNGIELIFGDHKNSSFRIRKSGKIKYLSNCELETEDEKFYTFTARFQGDGEISIEFEVNHGEP